MQSKMRIIFHVIFSLVLVFNVSLFAQVNSRVQAIGETGTLIPASLLNPVSIDLVDVPLERALTAIADEGNFSLNFSRSRIPVDKRVSLKMSNVPAVEALISVLDNTGAEITISKGGQIAITPVKKAETDEESSAPEEQTAVQQEHSGVISNEEGEPLIGANVLIEGTMVGAATDADGRFSFMYSPVDDYTLVVSYVGYRTVERDFSPGDNVSNLSFELETDPFGLDEIVVTGVASRTAKAVAEIAVSRVNIADLTEKVTYSSMEQMIAGKVAGVEIHTTYGVFGAPMRFAMRSGGGISGLAQPVVYIDGIKMENSSFDGTGPMGSYTSYLNSLNPEDIENIEIIKGPAGASSYGTGGSNGVVLITTKRGRVAGPKNWTITYKATYGYHDQIKEYGEQDVRSYRYVNEFLKRGLIQKNNVTVTGGTEQLRIYAGIEKGFEKGMLPLSTQDRTNLRANIDFFPSPKFNVRVSAAFQNNELQIPETGEWREVQHSTIMPYNVELFNRPTKEYYRTTTNYTFVDAFTGSATAEYMPFAGHANKWLRGLSGRLTIGIDDNNSRGENLSLPTTEELHNREKEGERIIDQETLLNLTYTGDVRYDYNFLGINAAATAGAQLFEDRSRSIFSARSNFTTDLVTNLQAGEDLWGGSERTNNRKSAGIFTEHSFSYQDTYFGSFMIRRDYASVLGRQSTDVTYPRVSFAVRFDRFEPVPEFVRLFKFRTAYGETGILPGRKDALPMLWNFSETAYGIGGWMSAIGNPDLKPERIKEWEIGFDSEIGNFAWEFSYYKQFAEDAMIGFENPESSGKLGGYYEQGSRKKINIGEIEGSGYESVLQAFFSGRRFGGWSANFSLTNSWMKNEVTSLGGGSPINESGQWIIEGYPKHAYIATVGIKALYSDGTNTMDDPVGENAPNVGDVVPEGEYYGFESERRFNGKGVPDKIGSFGATLSAYGFTLYGLLDWKGGYHIQNIDYIDKIWMAAMDNPYYFGGDPSQGIRAGSLVWQYDVMVQQLGWGDTGTGVQALTPGTPEYIAVAEKYARTNPWVDQNGVQKADFVRLKELSITYNADKLLPLLGLENYIQGLSIGVSGMNLYRWDSDEYTSFDPEAQQSGVRGWDDFGIQTHFQNSPLPSGKAVYSFIRLSI